MIENETGILRFPFLGTQEDGEAFQYLLLSVQATEVEISIQNWLVRRAKLGVNEKIDLYIPHQMNMEYRLREYVTGTVISVTDDIYKVAFPKETENLSLKYIFSDLTQSMGSLTDLTIKLVKDSLLLKSGIRIYLKHLIPYFSRIVNYTPEEYAHLKKVLLNDVLGHILTDEKKLKQLYDTLVQKLTKQEEIAIYIDLEELREMTESEISLPIFNLAFSESKLGLLEQFQVQSQFGYSKYLNAIKQLERRLFSNYNLLVIIYLNSI